MATTRTPLWLDCDTGHDDAFAILLAAHHPSVHLLGISTVYGNASLAHTTHNTRAVLHALGRDVDVPVYAGAARPLARPPLHAPDIHGETGLDGTTCLPAPRVPARTDRSALQAAYEALSAQPRGHAWVVATGALTNVAALFAAYPSLVEHVAGLSVMGGAIGGGFTHAPLGRIAGEGERFGNYTPWAEFNIYVDPEAAREVFANEGLAAKTVLVPLDLTHQFLATGEVQRGIRFGFEGGMGKELSAPAASTLRLLFFEIVTFFNKTYADIFGLTAGAPLHDPLAVAVTFVPHLFHQSLQTSNLSERFHVSVVTQGEQGASVPVSESSTSQLGRTIAEKLPHGQPGVTIPRSLDIAELWSMIGSCLTRCEESLGSRKDWN